MYQDDELVVLTCCLAVLVILNAQLEEIRNRNRNSRKRHRKWVMGLRKRRRNSSSSSDTSSDDDNSRKPRKRKIEESISLTSTSSSSSCSDVTTSSSSSESEEERKKNKQEEQRKRRLKIKKNKAKKLEASGSSDIPLHLMTKPKSMAPMTKEEWEKKQSVVRRVFDESTGRHRLIKGDGEVIEEIVSRDRHKSINQQATRGDGAYFQAQVAERLKK